MLLGNLLKMTTEKTYLIISPNLGMMKIRILIFSTILLLTLTFIGWMFWEQEVKYSLPTSVPSNFVNVKLGGALDLDNSIQLPKNIPVVLHFFSFNCSCSRFNMKDFEGLAKKHEGKIYFAVVLQSDNQGDVKKFQNKYDLDLPVVLDKDGLISDACGIYSTPQAVVLDKNAKLYFKGNYNKARFCTRTETKFVDLALTYLLNEEPLPLFIEYALTEPYGCTLPSDEEYQENSAKGFLSLFE
jgi:hypothetical protein